ncbi:MAG TPA: hypothetical protein ENI23_13455 [bacterium]|nr:hypothetical protein [bacterium]
MSFRKSPTFSTGISFSCAWPSRYAPADDGSCGENVAKLVLEAHDIPIVGNIPPRGNLCGLDINNMDARSAIKLSLAENMADGKFIELYMNEFGQAYFQEVYPVPIEVNLDIRQCIPTSDINQKIDLVIVRGYDTPPCRTVKSSYSILKDAEIYTPAEHLLDTCHGQLFSTEAIISYKDPVLETAYNDGVDNLYELKAFESLIGYVINFEGSSDPNVKYSFSDTTTKDVAISLLVNEVNSSSLCGGQRPSGLAGISLGNFPGEDIYGDSWPLFLNVHNIYLVGHKIISTLDLRASKAAGAPASSPDIIMKVDGKKQIYSLPAGNNWFWELGASSGPTVYLYYQTSSDSDSFISRVAETYSVGSVKVQDNNTNAVIIAAGTVSAFPGINDVMGVLVNKTLASVEIDRPSVTIQDPSGNALTHANNLRISYQPIIVTNVPPPIAYNFGGGARLIDHTKDLWDEDPSTQENHPETEEGSLAWLQTQTQGIVVDISLPFASEDDCLAIANTIYNLQNETLTSYKLVCGPTSEPKLGARVQGFEGRINSITETFQDGSQYNINVDIGPTFQNVGGWGQNIYQIRTSDISREAIILSGNSDGTNYMVRVQQLGVFNAINKTRAAYFAGEKVSVTVHNVPQERL